MVLAEKLGVPRSAVLARYPETGFVPFEPHLRYTASFNDDGGRTIAHVKGAAEVVIPMCASIHHDRAITQAEARNVLLLLMVFFENVNVFNCRSETRSVLRVPIGANPFLVVAVVATQLAHIGAMYVPGLNAVLGIAPVSVETWFSVAPIALSLVPVMEADKAFRARRR